MSGRCFSSLLGVLFLVKTQFFIKITSKSLGEGEGKIRGEGGRGFFFTIERLIEGNV